MKKELYDAIRNHYLPDLMFYTDSSCLNVRITKSMTTVSISIAKVLDGHKGRPEKGVSKYDYNKAAYFSVTIPACVNISRNISAILKGTYVNPKTNNDQYKHVFSLVNFPIVNGQKCNSFLSLQKMKNSNDNSVTMSITINPPKERGQEKATFVFQDTYELERFVNFINAVATQLDFLRLSQRSSMDYLKSVLDDSNNNSGYSKNNSNNNYSNNNQEEKDDELPFESPGDDSASSDSDDIGDIFGSVPGNDNPFV